MDVHQPAAGEDLAEFVFQQLVHAGAAGHHHGLDVEVVQRVGDAVEQHAVGRGNGLALVLVAAGGLRIAAAQVARRQHRGGAGMPEHGLGGEADLREQALGTATGEVEHRFRILGCPPRIADHRNQAVVVDVEQAARGAHRHVLRHRLVEEVDHLCLDLGAAQRGGRVLDRVLDQAEGFRQPVAQALRLVAELDHAGAYQLDRRRVGGGKEGHRRCRSGIELLLALAAQEVAHRHRDVAEIDVDRAGRDALVADRTVVGDVGKLVEVLQGYAAPRLLFVEEGLDQQRGAEDLVARAVEQVGARHVGRADRLALAAAQAVLDRVRNLPDVRLFHDQRLDAEQRE